jgi:Type III restriction enzyme, res subunit
MISKLDSIIAGSMVEPRPYQRRIVEKAYKATMIKGMRSVLIESATASGKTVMGLLLAKLLVKEHNMKVGWVAMRRHLLTQTEEENINRGINVPLTYISMYDKNPPENLDVLIVDEAQHDVASSMVHIHSVVKPKHILGLSATPYRSDRVKLCFDTIIKDAGIPSLIADGYLSPYNHFTLPDWTVKTVTEAFLRDRGLWGKSIIYFHKMVQCHEANLALVSAGVKSAVVSGESNAEAQIDAFHSGKLELLLNCMKLTEGFNAPDLKTVFCRPSCKPVTIQMCLDADTQVLTKAGWRTHATISADDMAAGFDCETGEISWVPVEDIVRRPVADGETFRRICGPHMDVRVTDLHDLVYKSRHAGKTRNRPWLKATATYLHANRRQPFSVPVAGNTLSRGVDLTDAELVLLGLFLTDGSYYKSRKVLQVSQASISDQVPLIEAAYANCGLKPWRGLSQRKGALVKYAAMYQYGVGPTQLNVTTPKLVKYLEAGKAAAVTMLEDINELQLAQLLVGMQIGDGRKNKTVDYTPKTYTLCLGNDYQLVDNFQALCVRKGYRCNVHYQINKTDGWSKAGTSQAVLSVKKQTCSTVCSKTLTPNMLYAGGSNLLTKNGNPKGRTQITVDQATPGELVWCIRNRLGTIVTRRNGKVLIMGNCGRVLRKHPDIPVKQIVQAAATPFPFPRFAMPKVQHIYSQDGWRTLEVNPHIAAVNRRVITALSRTNVELPNFIKANGERPSTIKWRQGLEEAKRRVND